MADNQPKSFIDSIKNVFSNPSVLKGAMLTPYEETVQKVKQEKPKEENKNLMKKIFGF